MTAPNENPQGSEFTASGARQPEGEATKSFATPPPGLSIDVVRQYYHTQIDQGMLPGSSFYPFGKPAANPQGAHVETVTTQAPSFKLNPTAPAFGQYSDYVQQGIPLGAFSTITKDVVTTMPPPATFHVGPPAPGTTEPYLTPMSAPRVPRPSGSDYDNADGGVSVEQSERYWAQVAQYQNGPGGMDLATFVDEYGVPPTLFLDVNIPSPSGTKHQSQNHQVKPQTGTRRSKRLAGKAPAARAERGRYGDVKLERPVPIPTIEYQMAASLEPQPADPTPKKILIVLDLNGTLVHRRRHTIVHRPYLPEFLDFLFKNFAVMIWSSARPQNVAKMVTAVLTPQQNGDLVGMWNRQHLRLPAEDYEANVQVFKHLTFIWEDAEIQSMAQVFGVEPWNQATTILIDDSKLKGAAQPFNLLEIPTFEGKDEQMKSDILKEVAGYLKEMMNWSDVSAFMHKNPFVADGTYNVDWN